MGSDSMTVPLVSIITPTFNRSHLLPLLSTCVLNQNVSDFEWLVLDDSQLPSKYMQALSDPRIIYEHIDKRATIGAKRNRLIEKSRADVIAQFDDDDFYGQNYLSNMISAMNENAVDFVKLNGFFLWSKVYKSFGYWDLMTKVGPHWVWSAGPLDFMMLTEQNNQGLKDNHLGYGFSYVFKKKVWECNQFPEIKWNEDAPFVQKALERFKLMGLQDHTCMCIHVLHESNTSRCFPQYVMPNFLVRILFPGAEKLVVAQD
jgi:glycosyltransferase involved in cell wall biosynthesis